MNNNTKSFDPTQKRSIRLLPGILLAVLLILGRYGTPIVVPEIGIFGMLSGVFFGLGIMIWWAFFSRASSVERWGATTLMIISLPLTSLFLDESLATAGQGYMFYIYALPLLCLVLVGWAIVAHHFARNIRYLTLVLTILLTCGVWLLYRIDGITGDFNPEFAWRWSATSEEQLLSADDDHFTSLAAPATDKSPDEWPGFRGTYRDGVVRGIHIKTNWSEVPPKELWRTPIGPGCSSFAVSGDMVFTQEQRGEDEIVGCYRLQTGDPIWRHQDQARFWDSHAGAGPRSTPTISNGRVYALGATGILNALDANDGRVIWSRNAVSDTDLTHSGWGYSSSPLVVDDIVIVAVVGKLIAYDVKTGDPRWFGPDGGDSYSSPHLFTIDGIKQVVLMSANGATSIDPDNGTLLWEYAWSSSSRIVQPAMTIDGDLMFSTGDGKGLRRLGIQHGSEGWSLVDRWTSKQLRPNFNDFVVHKGYAYGYSGLNLTCIDATNGQRKWKGDRYGGQILLLADQDLIIVLTEKGELVLVQATPDEFKEIVLLEAIEGKTWNHPVVVGNILLVRNTREMVAYQLSTISATGN
jgi:outer membrane protein assembly factor BamB